jgi:HK97 family phage major capsid protein
MATYKGVEIDTKPTESMANEAKRGLDWRSEFGRGGTEVGIARARDISNRSELSPRTIKRMVSFFARHEVDKQAEGFRPGEDGYPSNGRIAWALWGGDAGRSWANRLSDRLDSIDDDERSLDMGRPYPNEHAARIKDPDEFDDFRRMKDQMADGVDSIIGLKMTDGNVDSSEIQSLRFDKLKWSVDDAKAWLDEHDFNVIEFEPASEERVMERAEPDELKIGDFVEWDSSGGKARGQIDEVVRDGQIEVPDSDVVINGEPDDPAALIRIFQDGEPTDTMVGHRFSTLTKIEDIRTMEEEMDRKGEIEITHRSQDMEAKAIDEESRRVRMSISSEYPVERSFGIEVLEHSEEAIDLSFLNSGRAPLLLDHDHSRQVGIIESVELDSSARRLRATARLGRGALAREAFDDIVDGIKSNISIGYAINKMERSDKETYVAKSWRPMEASLVSLPADQSELVGVGRSAELPKVIVESNNPKEGHQMTDQVDIAAVEAEARKAAQKSAAQIVELGARHNQADLARKAIAEGRSIEEFRGELLEKIGSEKALENQEIGLSKKEKQRFSLFNVVHALANPTDRRAQENAAFEFEVSRAAAEKYGRDPQGIMVPFEVLGKRDLNSADDSALFSDDYKASDFIDVLRNSSSIMQAGARMLNGLSGDVKIPKKTAAASAGWIDTEGGAASESEMTVGTVSMVPRQLAAYTDITRQLRQQASLDVENLVRDDLAQALALAIDLAGLAGSGSSGQPTGIKNTSGINTVDFGTAPDLVPTFAQVVDMETQVAIDNALMGNLAYIMPAAMYGALKTVEKASGTAQFVVEPGGTINGYRAIVSNQAGSGEATFGNFADLLVGMWSGVDLTVDPFSLSTTGTIRLVAFQTVDVAVRHAVSFCLGSDQGS